MLYTEFVSADSLVQDIAKTKQKLTLLDEERPVGIQLYGKNIDAMVEAAKISEQYKPEVIDINFGCPVKKIAKKGAGSGMLRDIPKMIKMTKEIVQAVQLPVTVKTRLGWDEQTKVIVDVAEQLQDVGIAALTIHGRTRAQMYTGEADWTLIGEVKNNPRMHIPIIGNGDITGPKKAKNYLDKYGVDALMIGRPSIGRPWIFKEIKHYLNTGDLLPPLSVEEHIDLLMEQIHRSIDWLDERRGILHMRRHMALSFKNLPDFRPLRTRMLRANTLDELNTAFDEIRKTYKDYYIPTEE